MNKTEREQFVSEVRADYENRCSERRQFEAQWQLNANFVIGNQFCRIGVSGELEDGERDYYWQEREVYNHLATIVESRLAKLSRVRPLMRVMPASGDDVDVKVAKASGKILKAAQAKLRMNELISAATMWSELTGTAFYKVTWDPTGGRRVGSGEKGEAVREGDVRVDVCPPYEILPDCLTAAGVEECGSIIHAKAVSVEEVKRLWGVDVEPEDVDVVSLEGISIMGGVGLTGAVSKVGRDRRRDRVMLIERYTRPTSEKPEGELAIVAGKKLLYLGPLPYTDASGERGLPFIRQNALDRAGCFYGTCMVERAIPIQRAYNAVKNRKHEFLNRIAMGVLCVEDGSVDVEALETDGLAPGKILSYRQGSPPPKLLAAGSVPTDFTLEEQRLLDEFVDVSGISDIMRSSSVPATVTSGVAIQLLIEQDDTRISVTAENIRSAIKRVAESMLKLYRQFAVGPRLSRYTGEEGATELIAWSASDISETDVEFETENEVNSTVAARRSLMFDLLKAGLLGDENGRLDSETRYKILEMFGYGNWESTQDLKNLHVARAEKENAALGKEVPEACEVDDHEMHITEHTKYFLSSEFAEKSARRPEMKERLLEHIRGHKRLQAAAAAAANAAVTAVTAANAQSDTDETPGGTL